MQDLSFNPDPQVHDAAFERRLDQALATASSPQIPPEFAARVAAIVPASKPVETAGFAYARNSMILSAVTLFVALLLLAPHTSGGSTHAIAFEWILCVELSLLALAAAPPGDFRRSAL